MVKGRNKELAEMAKKVMKKLQEKVEKKGLKLSVTEKGKEGKGKMIASCSFLEEELRQCGKEEGVTLGSRSENKSKKAGSKRESEEENVQCKILNHKEA